MKKKKPVRSTLYVRIKKENHDWIKSQMKVRGFSKKRGQCAFVNWLLENVRARTAY